MINVAAVQKVIPLSAPFHPQAMALTPEISMQIVDVTPELAREWLKRNYRLNRKPRRGRVERYQRMMRDGGWRVVHQGIAFDKDGWIVDGQHRLLALANQQDEGMSIRLLVFVYNIDTRAMPAIDQGAGRTVADVLTLDGITDRVHSKKAVAAAVSLHQGLRRGGTALDADTVARVYAKHKSGIDYAVDALPSYVSPLIAAVAYAAPVDQEATSRFVHGLASGVGLEEGSGELLLRKYLASERRPDKIFRGNYESRNEIFYKSLSAIRLRLTDKSQKVLAAPKDGEGVPASLQWFQAKRRMLGLPEGAEG